MTAARAAAVAVAVAGLALVLARPAGACTTFLLEGAAGRVIGKSYDWHMGQGLVMFNKSGVAKQALTLRPGDAPARWVSRHASVTFNQYGRELPNGGMNDAGLVVEIMWLDSAEYEKPDGRPALNELQWIQYQLDSFASVDQMVAAASAVRVSPAYAKVHYLACDRGGACAAFEHVGGKQVVTRGARALTNHTYAESSAYAARQRATPAGLRSLDRFVRASRQAAAPPAGDPVTAGFQILDGVRGPESQWSIVYDPVRLRVHFRTRANRQVKWLDLGKVDGSCATAVSLVDVDADARGDVGSLLRPYSTDANRRLIERGVQDIRKRLPPGTVERLIAYPSLLTCAAKS